MSRPQIAPPVTQPSRMTGTTHSEGGDASWPFFIVGCGRSGTTLLRTLLNRHPACAIPLESLFITDYLRVSRHLPLAQLLPMMVREPEIAEWGLRARVDDLADCDSVSQAIDRLHSLYAHQHGKRRWGQKTPRFIRQMELLGTAFPWARFVHIIRDPRAVVNSLKHSDVHHSNALYGAKRWRADVGRGLSYARLVPERVLELRYETLVRDTEQALTEVCRFLELAWPGPAWWDLGGQATDEYSAFYDEIHKNLDRSISGEHIDKWTSQLSEREVEVVEDTTLEFMVKLGYEPQFENPSPSPMFVTALRAERLAGIVRQLVKYLRQRRRYLLFLFYRKLRLGLLTDFLRAANY